MRKQTNKQTTNKATNPNTEQIPLITRIDRIRPVLLPSFVFILFSVHRKTMNGVVCKIHITAVFFLLFSSANIRCEYSIVCMCMDSGERFECYRKACCNFGVHAKKKRITKLFTGCANDMWLGRTLARDFLISSQFLVAGFIQGELVESWTKCIWFEVFKWISKSQQNKMFIATHWKFFFFPNVEINKIKSHKTVLTHLFSKVNAKNWRNKRKVITKEIDIELFVN